MGKVLLIGGLVGFVLSLGVLGVSLILPVLTDNRINFREAMVGIAPGGLCTLLFLVLSIVGLVLVLVQSNPSRHERDDD